MEKWHPDTEDITYTMRVGAKSTYTAFANQIVDLMNKKWDDPAQHDSIGNVSKDVRTLLRLVLHVFVKAEITYIHITSNDPAGVPQ